MAKDKLVFCRQCGTPRKPEICDECVKKNQIEYMELNRKIFARKIMKTKSLVFCVLALTFPLSELAIGFGSTRPTSAPAPATNLPPVQPTPSPSPITVITDNSPVGDVNGDYAFAAGTGFTVIEPNGTTLTNQTAAQFDALTSTTTGY